MKRITPIFALMFICTAALTTTPVRSQSDDSTSPQLIVLKFAGGNVADYVAAVQKASGRANVFVAPEAKTVPMPAIELNQVSVPSALSVLHDRTHSDENRIIQLTFSEGGVMSMEEWPIFSIQARTSGSRARSGGGESSATNRVWSIDPLNSYGIKVEDILTAIQTSLDLIDEGSIPAKLRLHEATGILIARGTGEQLAAIDDVIRKLNETAAFRAARESKPEPAPSTNQ